MWTWKGGGGSQVTTLLHIQYFVKWSATGEMVNSVQKTVVMVYGCPKGCGQLKLTINGDINVHNNYKELSVIFKLPHSKLKSLSVMNENGFFVKMEENISKPK